MISREEVVRVLEESLPKVRWNTCDCALTEAMDMAIELLSQPERPKGRWIDAYPEIEKNPMFMYGICSECGCKQSISNKLNFCFDCGADMRGEEE